MQEEQVAQGTQAAQSTDWSDAALQFVQEAFSWVTPSLVLTAAVLYFLCTQVRRVALKLDFAQDEKRRNLTISAINIGVGALLAIPRGFIDGEHYGARLKISLAASALAMVAHEVAGKFLLPWIGQKIRAKFGANVTPVPAAQPDEVQRASVAEVVEAEIAAEAKPPVDPKTPTPGKP